VGLVSISGGERPAVRIQANPLALAAYGLDLETLRTAIGNAKSDALAISSAARAATSVPR